MKYGIFSTNRLGTKITGAICNDGTFDVYRTILQADYAPKEYDKETADKVLQQILRSRLSDHLYFEVIEIQGIKA